MKISEIEFIHHNKIPIRLLWGLFAAIYIYFLYIGFKYIPYTFLVKNPIPFIGLWIIILLMTNGLTYSGVYILFIDEIYRRRNQKCQMKKKK